MNFEGCWVLAAMMGIYVGLRGALTCNTSSSFFFFFLRQRKTPSESMAVLSKIVALFLGAQMVVCLSVDITKMDVAGVEGVEAREKYSSSLPRKCCSLSTEERCLLVARCSKDVPANIL